jgi:hypothetical protein
MQCTKHPFDRANDVCAHCGSSFCRPCLVYPHGERKPAFCVACTVTRSGIRSRGGSKPITKRQWKHRRKALMTALKANPDARLHFIELDEIPFVADDEILRDVTPVRKGGGWTF